ncbi:hypothetical protein ETB97_000347 [Aspergillus alliaceus]|uniref:LYR motif-containing protein Cup1-like N-terminal domain-containing protein n=2 Tax=Petromyces alliaceus TaxID=209559 RepID=A0A8H6A5G6_PETAA|nr:hypothetical protein ETB97_000347 [Aspergillus burnettii]
MVRIQVPPVPPVNPWRMESWKVHFRAILRECSYLPDPVAKSYMHDYVVRRFRRYVIDERRPWIKYDLERLIMLFDESKETLSLLKRANQGFIKPLEKVIRMAYGRKGKRRKELLYALISPDIPADTMAVQQILQRPEPYGDDWKPPSIVIELLKSQQNNGILSQLGVRQVKDLNPVIPKKVISGDGVAKSRRRNIRKEWYNDVLDHLLPPLPEPDLSTLEGLMSGEIPWSPPRERKTVNLSNRQKRARGAEREHLRKLLESGPAKGQTFREYAKGRPHIITRRLMQRLWRRTMCLIPRMDWDDVAKKHYFTWDPAKPMPQLGIPGAPEIFEAVDPRGKVTGRESLRPIRVTGEGFLSRPGEIPSRPDSKLPRRVSGEGSAKKPTNRPDSRLPLRVLGEESVESFRRS